MSKNPFQSAFEKKAGLRKHLIEQVSLLTSQEVSSWLRTIDESPYSLSEWVDSTEAFDQWAQSAGRTLTLIHMLEYLSCCAESGKSGVTLPLTLLMQEFIRSNGVED